MNPITKYVGNEVRRIVFALRKEDNTYYNLFTVIEALNDEMTDKDAFAPNVGQCYLDRIQNADGSEEKIYVAVEKVILAEAMVKEPWNNIVVGKNKLYPSADSYDNPTNDCSVIPLHSADESELKEILPKRMMSAYVKYFQTKGHCALVEHVLSDRKLKEQLLVLSKRNLGFDLSLHKKYLGGYILVCYNDIYHNIDFTEDSEVPGIYCRVNYRYGHHDNLTFYIKLFAKDGSTISTIMCKNEGKFLSRFDTGTSFHSVAIDVYDKDMFLIDYYPRSSFIHSIAITTNVKSKDVVVKDKAENGRSFEKYVSDGTTYIGERPSIFSLWGTSAEYSYKKFEDSLDFVFFDGEEGCRQKAKDCVMRILNSVREKCYICDIFFNDETLAEFVVGMKNESAEVRILSSKEKLDPTRKQMLKERIKEMREKNIANVACRLLRGTAVLHDRLIIADENVWMLGCSLNEFGVRATTLIRVPQEYSPKLIERVERWWNDNEISEDL